MLHKLGIFNWNFTMKVSFDIATLLAIFLEPQTRYTGCPRIGDPNLSVNKMVIFWDLWPEILDLEISLIYILQTTSRFSNNSIKNSLFGTYILVEIWLIWIILCLLCLIFLNKKHTVGLFDDLGPHSRCQFSHLIEKDINLGSKEYILWKKWSWEVQNCFKMTKF